LAPSTAAKTQQQAMQMSFFFLIGMIYYYFPTKDDLFLAVVEEISVGLLEDIEKRLVRNAPSWNGCGCCSSGWARWRPMSEMFCASSSARCSPPLSIWTSSFVAFSEVTCPCSSTWSTTPSPMGCFATICRWGFCLGR
jgi:hypothetical protein